MIILTGNSLGERQRALNERVNKAVADNAFDKLTTEPGESDVDKIFRIDVAAKNKNIHFIMEILRSGDVVHITRALNKCSWLGKDEFANIINVDNLHNNVFQLMSFKMKKKLLSMLTVLVKNENRSIAFYEFCMREKLLTIAMKFLFNTPELFKQDIILQKSKVSNMLLSNKEANMPNFIGNSFSLAHTLLGAVENGWNRSDLLHSLHYMYSISSVQYLEMLEKYKITENRETTRFGRRVSKSIIKNHKDRVLKKPVLYINILNKDKIIKNSSISDVKIYAVALLPEEASTFWNMNFYEKYKFILEIIPKGERFSFIKKIFTEKYQVENFEMEKAFYLHNFYNMMTTEEKEDWAIRHITSGEESLGNDNDYIWYKFVRFDKAFEEIKKYIHVTPDKEKRTAIINVLIDSVKTQNDLEILLNYYYSRHVNEARHHKVRFLDTIIQQHKVFDLNEECWTALEKIFYSLDVFNISSYGESNYRVIALIYYIIHGKPVLPVLNEFIDKDVIKAYDVKRCSHKLESAKSEMVFQYILKFYLNRVEALSDKEYKDNVKNSIDNYVQGYLDLLQNYSKTKDDIPEIINKCIKLNSDKFKYHRLLANTEIHFSEKNIMRYMKKDATLVIDEFQSIKNYIQQRFGRTNWLIKKLKVYFHHDIAQQYLQLLKDCLSADDVDYRMAQVGVYGIFKLADESYKIDFLQKHVPTNPKIDHATISHKMLQIQQAICGYACVSRPPLPMSCVHQYITGDYVHSCLPMFNYYLMNLPLPECITFVESLINKPISIQKHGLRLAFQCFSVENLKTLINKIWQRTKNVSVRKIIYNSLYDKVLKERDQTQIELFEVLNTLTLTLHQDDDDELFLLLSSNRMPVQIRGQYLVNGWKAVQNLPERCVNFERMAKVIMSIQTNFKLVPEDELNIIANDYITKMLDEKQILNTDNNLKEGLVNLLKAKWNLTLTCLANVYNEKQLKTNLKVVKHIIKICLEMWNEVSNNKYIMREFCRSFIGDLETSSYDDHETECYYYMKIINDAILKDLQESLPEQYIYSLSWKLRLCNLSRDAIIAGKQELGTTLDSDEIDKAIRTCLHKFAEDFVVLLKEYINNGKYFAAFHSLIESYVTSKLNLINRKLDLYYTLNLRQDDLNVLLCAGLLKFEMPEVYFLIVRILPVNYSGMLISDYKKIIYTLKVFKNTEIQYYMVEKFDNLDFL